MVRITPVNKQVVRLVQVVCALDAVVLSALIGLAAFAISIYQLINVLAATIGTDNGPGSFVVGLVFIAPLVGIASLALIAWLTVTFYRKFSGTFQQTE